MAKKIEMNEEEKKLYSLLQKEAKKANSRLARLESTFGANTWASKKLRNRLEAEKVQTFTDSGRISTSKNMSIGQMRATLKATQQFLNSKTSTITGIKEVREKQIKNLSIALETDEVDITYEQAEALYELFEHESWQWILKYMTPSEFFAIVYETVEKNDGAENFIKRIERYIEVGNDVDLKLKILKIYEEVVIPILNKR